MHVSNTVHSNQFRLLNTIAYYAYKLMSMQKTNCETGFATIYAKQ